MITITLVRDGNLCWAKNEFRLFRGKYERRKENCI
jgi:hypothetical protein